MLSQNCELRLQILFKAQSKHENVALSTQLRCRNSCMAVEEHIVFQQAASECATVPYHTGAFLFHFATCWALKLVAKSITNTHNIWNGCRMRRQMKIDVYL